MKIDCGLMDERKGRNELENLKKENGRRQGVDGLALCQVASLHDSAWPCRLSIFASVSYIPGSARYLVMPDFKSDKSGATPKYGHCF